MTISRHLNELRSFDIDATDDGVDTNVTTIAEDVVGEAMGGHLNTALAVSVEPVQFQFSLDHFCQRKNISWLSISLE